MSFGENHLSRTDWGHKTTAQVEKKFLSGPLSLPRDVKMALHIFYECLKGFIAFRKVGRCVTIFGSARFKEDHPYYKLARETASLIAQEGYAVVTGGGPGIMEASNRGAKEAGGLSLGCNILLPKEQATNAYLDKWVEFRFLFVRKLMLAKHSTAFVVMPGGWGTLDEFFEVATLIETGIIQNFPLILVGREYWSGLENFLRETLVRRGTIDEMSLDRILITDRPEDVASTIRALG